MSEKLYAERDIVEQGDYYSRHTSAMTGEGLHSKSDIAAELAHRDIEIARLQSEVERLRGRLARQNECICAIRNTAINAPNTHNMNWIVEHCDDAISGISPAAWLLRKQAEALESCADGLPKSHATFVRLHNEAQRLRQQADEAEKAGG